MQTFLKRFRLAHKKGELPIHQGGSRFPLEVGETIRDFLDTVDVGELDSWLRASVGYGFPMPEGASWPQQKTKQQQVVPPSGRDELPGWALVKPQRFQGYGRPLYAFLKAAHLAGQPCPKATDVLEAWRVNQPPEVAKVMSDSLDYYNADGNETKPANLEAIRKAIGRMTTTAAQLEDDSDD